MPAPLPTGPTASHLDLHHETAPRAGAGTHAVEPGRPEGQSGRFPFGKQTPVYIWRAPQDRKIPSVIDGTLGNADAVFDLLAYHLMRLGGCHATELVLVGDGAPWIWNRAEALRERLGVPRSAFREVVDYFHVVEKLGEVSKGLDSRWSEPDRALWVRAQKDHIKAGRVEEVERIIAQTLPKPPKDNDDDNDDKDFWSRNRERMRYGELRAAAVPIGSGAVESSVRRVINLRMKGASIFWNEKHAEGVLHLRDRSTTPGGSARLTA